VYIEFDWDAVKAAANLRKHGISFETATLVFYDPAAVFEQDREEDGEPRWQAIGIAGEETLLLVAHLSGMEDSVELIRIISARPVTKEERSRYEQANG
jgi:uncharacterized DUF497 family protein